MKRINNESLSGAANGAEATRRGNVVKALPGQTSKPDPSAPRLHARDARQLDPCMSEWVCFGAGVATGSIYLLAPVLEGAGLAPATINIAMALSASVSVAAFIASRTKGDEGQVTGAVRH